VKAVKASVQVGNESVNKSLDVGATHAVLELRLKKGLFDLQTTFQYPDDHEGTKSGELIMSTLIIRGNE
jgi:hypothetical protein